MAITIFGACASPYVRKVFIVAETLDLEFENIGFIPTNPPKDYHLISPLGKMPALTDGDLDLADSSVICDYLVNRYGRGEFYPQDPVTRAKALWFEEYADSRLAEVLLGVFFERVVKPQFKQEPTDVAKVDLLIEQAPSVFDYLESKMPSSGYILGEEMTIADIAVASQFLNAKYAKLIVEPATWPKLSAYVNFMLTQPSFIRRIEHDKKLLSPKR